MSHISAYFLMRSSSFRMYVEAVAESCWDVFRLAGRCLQCHITLRGVPIDIRASRHLPAEAQKPIRSYDDPEMNSAG